MIRFDGNRLLLVDIDNFSSRKLMLEIIRYGGKCSVACCFEDAKKLFNLFDYDLVLSCRSLPDGKLIDFIQWYQLNVCDTTLFAVIGNGPDTALDHLPYIDKDLPITDFLDRTNSLLFDFKEFESNLSSMSENNGVSFELTFDQRTYVIRPLEFELNSMVVGIEKTLAPGSIAKVKVTFHDFKKSEIFNLIGVMGKPLTESQVFQVDQSSKDNWNAVMKCLVDRQLAIAKFINKVAGT